jgi:VTC domain
MNIVDSIKSSLSGLEVISLKEVQKASLMRRKDSKYVFDVERLPSLLEKVSAEYRVMEIEGVRAQSYQTFYYDTPEFDMYFKHHRGMLNRHKIRFRKYGTSNDMFLEVKKKNAKGVTVKNRMETGNGEMSIQSGEEEFLNEYTPFECDSIIPVLENSFNRITLVNPSQTERITLDYNLWFSSTISEKTIEVPGVAIAEIKYGDHLAGSRFHAALRGAKISPQRISKYCIGMAILNPDLKQNLFKEKVRKLRKINNNYLQSIKN